MKRTILLSALALTFGAGGAAADILSGFDVDAESWTGYQQVETTYVASGGNPGGYLRGVDVGNSWGYLRAPEPFLSELAYGGRLAFDLRAFTDDPLSWPIEFDVRVGIVGDGLVLLNEATIPDGEWRTYEFRLDVSDAWRIHGSLNQNYSLANPAPTGEQLAGVLANATLLVIAADFTDGTTLVGVVDETHLDNVTVVPEPGAAAGGLAALLGIAAARRLAPARSASLDA